MSYFLSTLKQSGHLDEIHLTIAVIGSRVTTKETYDQNGMIWREFIPNLTILGFDADQEACDRINAELAAKNIEWNEIHIPVALGNAIGERTLYITHNPACSSLYHPSDCYTNRFAYYAYNFQLVARKVIETTTLDAFCELENIESIDFIQIDVQGAELDVFHGASQILRNTLGIRTEVEFLELYENQPLFTDVDIYLRSQGFTLFDFTEILRERRKDIPIFSAHHPGPLFWTDTIYFRDLISSSLSDSPQQPDQILKLACIADAMNFPDYALEVLVHLTRTFGQINQRYNFASVIIESLSQIPELLATPEVQEKGLNTLPLVIEMQQYL